MGMNLLLIFAGGGVGAVLRYLVSTRLNNAIDSGFPIGILCVNILGSFAIGVFAGIVSRETFAENTIIIPLCMIGLLGGFTTFSAFSLETIALLQAGKYMAALIYISLSLFLSIFVAYLGLILAK
ncbi:MAG: fluoride efflux transporter CrcB [Alphaproteobacteria bacterium CG11_big_fil_rev_8_21_14_0_20_44_7]|nr:MAG: fluoride efflux transporter CrcB [Alphaproteobacteria bacterium CG11_big_fil_rev_8_21_14_0_20_44_7]